MKKPDQLAVVYWPLAKLKPYIRNPRKNDHAVDRMCESIKQFGFTVPVLARKSGEVIDGHLRLKAAAKLGLSDVPVILCDSWNDALMNGQKAGLMNTDPPYGVSYNNSDRPNPGVAKPRVANDEFKDGKLQAFLEAVFHAAVSVALFPSAAWYLWHAHLTQGFFAAAAAAAAAAVILHRQIIWVKPVLLLGRGQYHWKHEPCFMGWVEGHQPPDYGERNQTTVWEIGQVTIAERREFNHSTPKPVELFRRPILKHLKAGEIAYEPFSGTGPQFIAAESTGRICYGLELSPAYCDVIVSRWQNLTGKTATLEAR